MVLEGLSLAMNSVDRSIATYLRSDTELIERVANYIIHSGGKRIRPKLLMLSYALVEGSRRDGFDISRVPVEVYDLAAMIEFIHTATLLHDDVVDQSEMRRRNRTANAIFGNAASVLVGDFIYTRAFEIMVRLGNIDILALMSKATNAIAEGEVLQLMNVGRLDIGKEEYLKVIEFKTARLFEASTRIGAILSLRSEVMDSEDFESRMGDFGRYLGIAFQIYDDLLDYCGDQFTIGKNLGDDLREGKVTLPLIHVLERGTDVQRKFISDSIFLARENPKSIDFQTVSDILGECGAIEFTRRTARFYSERAIESLSNFPESGYKDCLIDLCNGVVSREG